MVQINFAQKSVTVKIVYYGPGMSGKTTNLEVVHQRAPDGSRGDLTSISTDGDRTLFFDFMPLDLGTVAGMRTQFQIYTVPGQVYYNSTRKLVLQGVDGVIFVADSSASMMEENLESLRNLEENLAEYGKDIAEIPLIIQYNKRDLPDALPVAELDAQLNPWGARTFEATANSGQGVFPTLKALAARVLESIHDRTAAGPGAKAVGQPAPKPQAPAPQAPRAQTPAPPSMPQPQVPAPQAAAPPPFPQAPQPAQRPSAPQAFPVPQAAQPAAFPQPMPMSQAQPPAPLPSPMPTPQAQQPAPVGMGNPQAPSMPQQHGGHGQAPHPGGLSISAPLQNRGIAMPGAPGGYGQNQAGAPMGAMPSAAPQVHQTGFQPMYQPNTQGGAPALHQTGMHPSIQQTGMRPMPGYGAPQAQSPFPPTPGMPQGAMGMGAAGQAPMGQQAMGQQPMSRPVPQSTRLKPRSQTVTITPTPAKSGKGKWVFMTLLLLAGAGAGAAYYMGLI
ncbi:MAG TPA: ADP-ribosylation factor-like protein [Planctomycetota bacterium]|nr:ADP-ribosylation factor-like protein [Planctomycetota bacterium]